MPCHASVLDMPTSEEDHPLVFHRLPTARTDPDEYTSFFDDLMVRHSDVRSLLQETSRKVSGRAGVEHSDGHRVEAGEQPAHSFRSMLEHLGTLTRNRLHINGTGKNTGFDLVTTPTPIQRQAFELIGQPIPTTIGGK